ncbi:DUF2975 domain-containing protein [Enterococcus sp. AZ196]|uniref:DUF2975 domain-containing protein n=1 Tax=Enterococcus sp. AZ196 TaxID=2774659 RepID=UPI003D2A05E8
MKSKSLFGLLQGLFTIGMGIMIAGVAAVTIFGVGMNFVNLDFITENVQVEANGIGTLENLEALRSPLTILAVLLVFVILIVVFRLSGKIFKELKNDNLFVGENVVRLKQVALLVGSLSILSSLPSLAMNYVGVTSELYMFDIGYFITALIIFAFAKVWERANEIAEENEFTI